MNLSDEDIDEIRASYIHLSSKQQRAGDVFYEKLFEIAPDTRELFVLDIDAQSTKLMSTLGLVVSQLQNTHDLEPIVRDLALRHLAYGVEASHYEFVGPALLAMLPVLLGEKNKPETIAAWRRAYEGLSNFMIEAAYPSEGKV